MSEQSRIEALAKALELARQSGNAVEAAAVVANAETFLGFLEK